jgi:hypothetical protein
MMMPSASFRMPLKLRRLWRDSSFAKIFVCERENGGGRERERDAYRG